MIIHCVLYYEVIVFFLSYARLSWMFFWLTSTFLCFSSLITSRRKHDPSSTLNAYVILKRGTQLSYTEQLYSIPFLLIDIKTCRNYSKFSSPCLSTHGGIQSSKTHMVTVRLQDQLNWYVDWDDKRKVSVNATKKSVVILYWLRSLLLPILRAMTIFLTQTFGSIIARIYIGFHLAIGLSYITLSWLIVHITLL